MCGITFCILVYLLGILCNFNRNHFLKRGQCYITAPMLSLQPTGIYLFNYWLNRLFLIAQLHSCPGINSRVHTSLAGERQAPHWAYVDIKWDPFHGQNAAFYSNQSRHTLLHQWAKITQSTENTASLYFLCMGKGRGIGLSWKHPVQWSWELANAQKLLKILNSSFSPQGGKTQEHLTELLWIFVTLWPHFGPRFEVLIQFTVIYLKKQNAKSFTL